MNDKRLFCASAEDFKKIPGLPIAYWVGEKAIDVFEKTVPFNQIADVKQGIIPGNVERFVRSWYEVGWTKIGFAHKEFADIGKFKKKWFPYNKGGGFRRWYGNCSHLIEMENDGYAIKYSGENNNYRLREPNLYFKEAITWSKISSGDFSARYMPSGTLFDIAGCCIFGLEEHGFGSLAFLNSSMATYLLGAISPTLNYEVEHIKRLPAGMLLIDKKDSCNSLSEELVKISRSDWDEYETSWDFKVNPLVREGWQKGAGGMSLEAAWAAVFTRRMEWAARMKELEEANNRLFIEAYGLEEELKPDVAWKDVSITGNPAYRYKSISDPQAGEQLARADAMRELISYGMGILMGRYSLEQEGLILASQGETYQDYLSRVHGVDKIRPDDDGIIPAIALDGDIFSDNLLHRMREFLSAAFGNDVLPANLNFIEAALDCKFDKYLTERFFDDHVKTYRKRPIYWLFESPKGYFRAFAYMHRMTGATAGLIRNKYLLPYIAHLEKCLASESAKGSAMTAFERKRVKEIEKAIADCKKYDLTLHDIAGRSIAIDLDDGVVVNWEKFKTVLAKM